MNANDYAAGVCKRLATTAKQGGGFSDPDHVQLFLYAMMIAHALSLAEKDAQQMYPHSFRRCGYTVDFCRRELTTLEALGIDGDGDEIRSALVELMNENAGNGEQAFFTLQGAVDEFMPIWCANTGFAKGTDRLPVYTSASDYLLGVNYLVNEALREPFEVVNQDGYPIPLRELLYGTWHRFVKFPNPYNRESGEVKRLRRKPKSP